MGYPQLGRDRVGAARREERRDDRWAGVQFGGTREEQHRECEGSPRAVDTFEEERRSPQRVRRALF